MSNYFFTENGIKYRLVARGPNKNGDEWYSWECKKIDDPQAEWERGCFGTEEYFKPMGEMTEQDKEWARKNAKS